MHLGKFVLIRATQIVITFFIILTLLFVLFRVAPGDPASMVIDPQMTPEDIEEMRAVFGLDKPLYQQYLLYVKNFIRGEFGSSFYYGKPVIEVIGEKLPNTILLFYHFHHPVGPCGNFLGKGYCLETRVIARFLGYRRRAGVPHAVSPLDRPPHGVDFCVLDELVSPDRDDYPGALA